MELLQYSFSDLYINSNKDFYISDEKYANSLKRVEPSDKEEFCEQLFMIMHQTSSYSLNYKGKRKRRVVLSPPYAADNTEYP